MFGLLNLSETNFAGASSTDWSNAVPKTKEQTVSPAQITGAQVVGNSAVGIGHATDSKQLTVYNGVLSPGGGGGVATIKNVTAYNGLFGGTDLSQTILNQSFAAMAAAAQPNYAYTGLYTPGKYVSVDPAPMASPYISPFAAIDYEHGCTCKYCQRPKAASSTGYQSAGLTKYQPEPGLIPLQDVLNRLTEKYQNEYNNVKKDDGGITNLRGQTKYVGTIDQAAFFVTAEDCDADPDEDEDFCDDEDSCESALIAPWMQVAEHDDSLIAIDWDIVFHYAQSGDDEPSKWTYMANAMLLARQLGFNEGGRA